MLKGFTTMSFIRLPRHFPILARRRFFATVTLGDLVPTPPILSRLGSIPLFNMHYSGAIKSTVYGLYLRFVTPQFGVISWRLMGIFMVALGLMVFVLLVGRSLSATALGITLGLRRYKAEIQTIHRRLNGSAVMHVEQRNGAESRIGWCRYEISKCHGCEEAVRRANIGK